MWRKGKKIATKNICVKASNVYQKPTIINLKGWMSMNT
jgi:hypothetical protein